MNHLKTPQQHHLPRAAVFKCGNHTRKAENGAVIQNISPTPTVCWGQFAQGLSLSVMGSLYSLPPEGFVLCALLSSHTQPRLPKHASDIPVGSHKPLTHESHSKPQLPVGPVQSSLVEANNLSDSTKGPTEQPQSHCHCSTLLRGHIIPSLG